MTRPSTIALLLALALAFAAGAVFENALHREDVANYQQQLEVLSDALEDANN